MTGGYGRAPDGTLACPRGGPQIDCAARRGHLALTTCLPVPWPGSVCRGCGERPLRLLEQLAAVHPPARALVRAHRTGAGFDADRLAVAAAAAAEAAA